MPLLISKKWTDFNTFSELNCALKFCTPATASIGVLKKKKKTLHATLKRSVNNIFMVLVVWPLKLLFPWVKSE